MIPKLNQYKKWSLPSKYAFWGVVIALFFGILQILKCSSDNKENERLRIENTQKGSLESIMGRKYNSYNVRLGGFNMGFSWQNLVSGINISSLLMTCNEDSIPLSIRLKNGKIMLSCKFYNLNDEVVGEIMDNNWTLNPNSLFMRNFDDYAIEVIDNYGVIVMQVRVEENNIIINGVVHCSNLVFICNEGSSYNLDKSPGAKKHMIELTGKTFKDAYLEKGREIERIFVYSGDDWIGKRRVQKE
jgi:hypothetical protein